MRRVWQWARPILGNARIWLTHPRRETRNRLRRRFFRLAGRFTPVVACELNQRMLILPTADQVIAGMTFVHGGFESETLDRAIVALDRHAGVELKGKRVIEIGANIGIETLRFLLDHQVAHVTSFEPHPANHRLLLLNVTANVQMTRVSVHQLALSDHDGLVEFEESPENSGDHRVRVPGGASTGPEAARSTIQVRATTLDRLVADGKVSLDEVALVWIDTQGHESHVLAGAGVLLDAGIPVVVEYWPYALRRAGGLERFERIVTAAFDSVIDLRSNTGLEPSRLSRGELPVLDATDAAASTDLLLLPARD